MHEQENGVDRIGPDAALTCRVVETILCALWSEQLERPIDSPYVDFFEAGGDSVSLIEIVAAAQDRGLPVRSSDAFRHLTPAKLAEHLVLPRSSVECAKLAAQLPTFADTAVGDVAFSSAATTYRRLPEAEAALGEPLHFVHSDRYLQAERDALAQWAVGTTVHSLRLDGAGRSAPGDITVAQIADRLLIDIRALQPVGPYRLAGFEFGVPIAYEMARRLSELNETVALLVLIEPPDSRGIADIDSPEVQLGLMAGRFALTGEESLAEIHARMRAAGWFDDTVCPDDLPLLQRTRSVLASAVFSYPYPPYEGPGVLITGRLDEHPIEQAWICPEPVAIHRLDYGLESPLPVLRDTYVTATMKEVLGA